MGSFKTKDLGQVGTSLQELGKEWGTPTSRQRRYGWRDLVVLRYSMAINYYTALNLTKLDVLDGDHFVLQHPLRESGCVAHVAWIPFSRRLWRSVWATQGQSILDGRGSETELEPPQPRVGSLIKEHGGLRPGMGGTAFKGLMVGCRATFLGEEKLKKSFFFFWPFLFGSLQKIWR
ncbi:adenylosuccinate synthetase domain-containing protein [Cordyceps javanica]|uniref:Adenylosuccinate synthetase domain-containing protein n=1 Tax=Cordyceps javanica TaxID=43265 RepID=A0A545V9Y9_9HYPO|nr:adenylosuccinate synthetase domain-containing protein [Cordyceps javanica]